MSEKVSLPESLHLPPPPSIPVFRQVYYSSTILVQGWGSARKAKYYILQHSYHRPTRVHTPPSNSQNSFRQMSKERRDNALTVPRPGRIRWSTLARDRDNWCRRSWCPIYQQDDRLSLRIHNCPSWKMEGHHQKGGTRTEMWLLPIRKLQTNDVLQAKLVICRRCRKGRVKCPLLPPHQERCKI